MFFAEDTLCGRERFASEVADQMAACMSQVDAESGAAEELALAVSEYAANHAAAGGAVRASDIVFLAARALWAVGKPAQSGEFIRRRGAELGLPAECSELVCCGEASLPVWRLAVERRLRRRFSSSLTGGAMWTVNLSDALPRGGILMELTFFAAINALIERTAFFWDKTSGKGILGLCGLGDAARVVCGRKRREKAVKSLCAETLGFCKDKLAKTSEERAWTTVPMVLRLGE